MLLKICQVYLQSLQRREEEKQENEKEMYSALDTNYTRYVELLH